MPNNHRLTPVRVLHVLGNMNRGGIETWLMHVLRHVDRERFRMDFLVHTARPCAYDEEIRALGSRIIPCLPARSPWRYAREFRRLLREHGPYDVVHAHMHRRSGLIQKLAAGCGVPLRLAHSHNDVAGPLRRIYVRLCRPWIRRYATAGLACSAVAARALFGPAWERDGRVRVLHYGLDFGAFRGPVDRRAVRAELGLPADAFVVGHVARFARQKNHAFLVEIGAEVLRRRPDAALLLVGDGPLRPAVEARVRRLGLAGKVVLAGVRPDVPRLMRGAMDAFVFPSSFEGLGLVAVEAQAAGLPCFLSPAVPHDADVVPPLVHRLDFADTPAQWADAILQRCGKPPVAQPEALALVERSPFNIGLGVAALQSLYGRASRRLRAAA